jgi:CheY-like chemotaxis protein
MDVQLPELDGYEVTKLLRSGSGPNCKTPVIGLTAHAIEGEREKCIGSGMNDYEPKPFNAERLKEKIIRLYVTGKNELTANFDYLLEVSGNDREFISKTAGLFINDSGKLFTELRSACLQGKTDEGQRILHKLKPGLIMFGMPSLYQSLKDCMNGEEQQLEKLQALEEILYANHRVLTEKLKAYDTMYNN